MIQKQFLLLGRATNKWFYIRVSYMCVLAQFRVRFKARIVVKVILFVKTFHLLIPFLL